MDVFLLREAAAPLSGAIGLHRGEESLHLGYNDGVGFAPPRCFV
jgi:hypothetical protein